MALDATSTDMRLLALRRIDSDQADLSPYFDQCADFIHEALVEGHGVLVHCQQGVSRSASIVLSYLIKHKVFARDCHAIVSHVSFSIDSGGYGNNSTRLTRAAENEAV